MRLHVVGLPWTQTTREYLHCAYTQKTLKFCDMMMAEGHEVFLYAGTENEANCTEHIEIITDEQRQKWYGPWDTNNLFGHIDWDSTAPPWIEMNTKSAYEIGRRAEKQDFLMLLTGSQSPILHSLPHLLPVEWAVGYEGISTEHRIFESYAWMHHVYGLRGIKDGQAFDAVIPNFFDLKDFPYVEKATDPEYLLYIGRLTTRKGPHIAAQIAHRAGKKLLIAGPGVVSVEPGKIITKEIIIENDNMEYIGSLGREERAVVMGNVGAVIVPTIYVEPFGGVAVEAMLTGTPVIASDWGAFPETVPNGIGGFRFRTLREGVQAVEGCKHLPRDAVRNWAESNYSLEAVGWQFTEHLERLATRWGDGWYAE